jgi:thioesterase domain-containing protein
MTFSRQVLSGYSRNYFAETLRDFIIKSKAKQANNENNNNANPFNNILNNNYQNQPAEVDPFQQAKNENMEELWALVRERENERDQVIAQLEGELFVREYYRAPYKDFQTRVPARVPGKKFRFKNIPRPSWPFF